MLSGRHRLLSLVLNTICTEPKRTQFPRPAALGLRVFHSAVSKFSVPMAVVVPEAVATGVEGPEPSENLSKEPAILASDSDGLDALPKVAPEDTGFVHRERKDVRVKLKKCAILLGYSGHGFSGMQCNPEVETIENVLLSAMAKLKLIPENWRDDMQVLGFQRTARTDKGVSAAGQVISIPLADPSQAVVDQVNAELPPVIRLFGLKRATRSFNCKNWCSSRTYTYLLPTMAFAPIETVVSYDCRIEPEKIQTVNRLLKRYLGSNNFHNFTTGVKAWQDSAKRFIREISCSDPFVREDIEFATISVNGQSFMMHQIRKMIGLVIAVMRGHVEEKIFDTVYGPVKANIPRAPGLGLMLDQCHFDMYNRKFGKDGCHEALLWPECKETIAQFKEEHIFPTIIRGEKDEKSMLSWLQHLPLHEYGVARDPAKERDGTHSALGDAQYTVDRLREREMEGEESESGGSDSEKTVQKKKLKMA
ncbi:pseudouridylate synthase 1 homolog [Paramacrobiotus metropolitanus]|uniref:pseudouridylate synthase 1 homolog n=1 Tax=Paramacrobiotus metropolitanus TaxID=2943436 RepID=UPI00244618EA|nr:pseudouridylate synthase 1 homolog [Paramacrobiotus metropolitanus]